MKHLARRLTISAAGGIIAIAAFTGCGIVNSAMDCATVGDTMTDVLSKVQGEPKPLKESTDKLRSQSEDIESEGLKKSALDFADEAENVNSAFNGDVGEGAQTDLDTLKKSSEDFVSECNAVG